jgi:hypothetical protein
LDNAQRIDPYTIDAQLPDEASSITKSLKEIAEADFPLQICHGTSLSLNAFLELHRWLNIVYWTSLIMILEEVVSSE